MTVNNTTIANSLYPVANAGVSSSPFIVAFQTRDPTVNDTQYPIQKVWLNTATNSFFFLRNFTSSGGSLFANWITLGGGGTLEKFAVQAGTTTVLPASGIVTFNGAAVTQLGVPVQTKGTGPNTMSLNVQYAGEAGTTSATIAGLAGFDSAQFDVDANGWVQLGGGTTPALQKISVDTHTGPGTDPVVADNTGTITITGNQIATGTIGAHVIRTDSLAANTFTIEIQQTAVSAAKDTTKNGVAHFNSADFIDDEGFITLVAGAGQTITGNDSIALSPTAGNWNILGNGVIGSGKSTAGNIYSSGSGSTLTINSTQAQFMTNYTAKAHATSPYTVALTDYYISIDTTDVVTVKLPDAPTTNRMFIIKDRTGNAAAKNITVTTVTGAVTIDGSTTQLMATNYMAITALFNGTSYELF